MKKWPWVFIACLLFIIPLKMILQKPFSIDVKKALNAISEEDKEALDWLFRYLNQDGFYYVLFGNKPMAISSFLRVGYSSDLPNADSPSLIYCFFESMHIERLKLKKGLDTWKKYQHLFPSSEFIFLYETESLSKCCAWESIILIHKKVFLKKVEEHIEYFKEVLGNHVTPEILLEKAMKSSSIFHDVLNYHDGLLGILLGYGEKNAKLFFRKVEIDECREKQRFSLTKKSLFPSRGFSHLDEEYQWINEKLMPFTEGDVLDYNPLFMTLPGFGADFEDSETQKLKKEYLKQYRKIVHEYKKGGYLEITLNQLVTEHSS